MKQDNKDFNIDADAEEDSRFLDDEEFSESSLDLGGLFSRRFTNIMPLYSSPRGVTEVHTATRYGKRYLLKGLKAEYRNDPVYLMGLAKEFEIGMRLEHPNIRRTIGLETFDNLGQVIVLEYIDGVTLDELLSRGRMNRRQGREIVARLVDALGYLHDHQVFHRDLKPSNILVTCQGRVPKIIDFNLSDSNDFIVLKNPAGSRKYMAPELLVPGAPPTAVADIYSLGGVIEEIATATGDSRLGAVAVRSKSENPIHRPQSVTAIELPDANQGLLGELLSSPILTYILTATAVAMAATLLFHIHLWKIIKP